MKKLLLVTALVALTPLLNAQAEEACGKPDQPVENLKIGEAGAHCNIYARQFEYRKNRLEFREQLEERRKDYLEPQVKTIKKHEKDMAALNEKRSHGNDVTAK